MEDNLYKIGIIICQDKTNVPGQENASGRITKEFAEKLGCQIVKYEIVPNEKCLIASDIRDWSDIAGLDLIFTVGGSGLSDTDCVPEATRESVDRLCPGIPEYIRWNMFKKDKLCSLSRITAGLRKKTLVINIPSDEISVKETLETLASILPDALNMLKKR